MNACKRRTQESTASDGVVVTTRNVFESSNVIADIRFTPTRLLVECIMNFLYYIT